MHTALDEPASALLTKSLNGQRSSECTMQKTTHTVLLIQVLRAVAAVLVLIGHTISDIKDSFPTAAGTISDLHWPGGFGVDLFFCISGFIMVMSTGRLFGKAEARKTFLIRRAIRLVPMYWVVTLFYLFLLIGSSHPYTGNLLAAVVSSLSFIPYPTYGADQGLVFPICTLGWSLNYEVFFYLVFAVFIVLPMRRAILSTLAILLGITALGLFFSPQTTVLRFWTQPIILEFGLGIGVAWFSTSSIRVRRPYCVLIVVVAIGVLIADPFELLVKRGSASTANDLTRLFGWGVPAAMILFSVVWFEKQSSVDGWAIKKLAFIGDSSYSLYLLHPFAIIAVRKALPLFANAAGVTWYSVAFATIVLAVAFSCLNYAFVEKPSTNWLQRRLLPAKL